MWWGIAEGWLSVVGTLLLTVGTGAQARANQADYRSLQRTASKVASGALNDAIAAEINRASPKKMAVLTESLLRSLGVGGRKARFWDRWQVPFLLFLPKVILFTLVSMPGKFNQLRTEGGDEAVQLARSLRLAEVWAILMVGSALALAAAVIQLVLAYR